MNRRSWSEVAPDTEETWRRLPPQILEQIRRADDEVLAAQRARVSPDVAAKISEATYSLRNRLRYWEELVRNLESDWAPDGRYIVDEYVNNLDSRDGVDRVLSELPPGVAEALRPLLDELDGRFRQSTVHDGGNELRPWVARLREGSLLGDRWYRRPRVIPWH